MMWSITTCRTLYVNVAPNYRSEGRARRVRVLEGPACRVREILEAALLSFCESMG